MARAIVTDQQIPLEAERMRMALAAGRMCALNYHVGEDRLECACDWDAAAATALQPLNGHLADVMARLHADDRVRVERAIQAALEGGTEVQFEARLIQSQPGQAQRTTWILVHAAVERDAHGQAVRLVGVARDNTARREGQTLRHAQAHGERLRALGQMASGIAHDLNQSLALITGYSDMARQELTTDQPDLARVREMVEITAQAALEGGHALRGLLTFVRSQELFAEIERVDVRALLQEVARLTAPRWRDATQVEGRPIRLRVQSETDLAISGSMAALREAITNLIFNAVDALPDGGSIQLVGLRRQDRVVIEVRDTGTGMPPDVRAHMFDPFFTTKGERGTGLGLPQVLSIVERHTGSIEVESEPGHGTTFRLSLPATDTAATRTEAPAPDRANAGPRRSIRVLVVEDEDQLARMASLVLKQRGHVAVVASSGEEAIAILEAQPRFDLVISDLGLGAGRNGWEVADAVRRCCPDTRFVLVTGWGAAIDPVEARARGIDRVIAKPYRIAELREVADDVAAELANR